jgi:hypothetical protein
VFKAKKEPFLALNQMMSKGTIQAELRGQLARRYLVHLYYGKAVGVTEKNLLQ